LASHSDVKIVSRDRGGGYGEAADRAPPNAIPVADRRRLMENASAAFLDAVRKTMRVIRNVLGAASIDPKLLTAAERLRYEGYRRREEANAEIVALARGGLSISPSSAGPGTAATSSDGSSEAKGATFSERVKLRSIATFRFLKSNGAEAAEKARSYGDGYGPQVSRDHRASSMNGRRGAGERNGQA
jgi:transposase